MGTPHYISCILKEKKITDLLESREILPARKYEDKLIYHCPLHKGDNEPSFTVYINEDYQNYYCYGCKSGGNIINLVSALDDITLRKSISQLVEGIKIDEGDAIRSVIEEIGSGKMNDNDTSIEQIVLKINNICYMHFSSLNFDESEINFFDDFFKKIDNLCLERDREGLLKVRHFLVEDGLDTRKEEYNKAHNLD